MRKFCAIFIAALITGGLGHMGHDHGDETTDSDISDHDHPDHDYGDTMGHSHPGTGEPKWQHNLKLPKPTKMSIKWNSTDPENLFMEMCASVSGYVAVGFCSPWLGTMEGCDIVIGWVDIDGPHLFDYHATGNSHPVKDIGQDYSLVNGAYENGMTRIIFKRKWNTLDKNDMNLKNNSVQIIWAWQSVSPKKVNGEYTFQIHDNDTKSHTLQMRRIDKPKEEHGKEHADHSHSDHHPNNEGAKIFNNTFNFYMMFMLLTITIFNMI